MYQKITCDVCALSLKKREKLQKITKKKKEVFASRIWHVATKPKDKEGKTFANQ